MFSTSLKIFTLLNLICISTGCVSILDATSKGPIDPDPTKRSFGTYLDDKRIRNIVKVNIRKADPALAESNIRVGTYNGLVLLTGEVPSREMREMAGSTARKVKLVRQVFNELTVQPNSTFLSRRNDDWLKTKINAKLLANSDVDASRVDIIVEDNVVYLMGMLSQAQAEKITDVIADTGGITKVVRAIQYIED